MKNILLKKINFLNIIFYLFLFAFTLGNLQRIKLVNLPPFYLHEIFMAFWLLIYFAKNKIKLLNFKKILDYKIIYLLIINIFFSWVIALLTNNFSLNPIFYIFKLIFYVIFIYYLNKNYNLKFIPLILAAGFLYLGLLQYFFLPDTRFLAAYNWDDHYFRLISSLLDPNFAGLFFVLSFFYLISLNIKNKILSNFFNIILFFALLLTYSRASFLSFIISLIFLIFIRIIKKQKIINLIIYLVIFATAIFFLPNRGGEGTNLARQASIIARVENSQNYLNSSKNYFEIFFGQGLFTNKHPDNLIIQIYSQLGILGLILTSLILIKIIKYFYKKNYYLLIILTSYLIFSQFNATLTQAFILFLTLLIINNLLALKPKFNQ